MTLSRQFTIAPLVALALVTSACGGSNGGSLVISTPAPPPGLTPTPASIGAPARAAIPNANLLPQASEGGPTMATSHGTVFPLLQTAVSINSSGVSADTATINAGGSLVSKPGGSGYLLNLGNSALGVANVVLSPTTSGVFKASIANGGQVFLQVDDPASSQLSWSSYGFWDVVSFNGARTQGAFVTGLATPNAAVPKTGSATFTGKVAGEVILPQAGRENGVNYFSLEGDANLEANFASGTVTGRLTNMTASDFDATKLPWNSMSLVASFVHGENFFNGTTAATSAPGNTASLKGTATGTLAGMLFGPSGQELGAVWTLSDGVGAAFGTIRAKPNPSGANPWDY